MFLRNFFKFLLSVPVKRHEEKEKDKDEHSIASFPLLRRLYFFLDGGASGSHKLRVVFIKSTFLPSFKTR